MVEPIGLVGTLLAIVQVSSKLVSICYEYRERVKDAPRELMLVLNEATSVRNITERLINLTNSCESSTYLPSLQSTEEADSPLQQCLSELLGLKDSLKLEKPKKGKFWSLKFDKKKTGKMWELKWPLKRSEVEKRLSQIARIKATLQLALSADNTRNMLEILTSTQYLPQMEETLTRIDLRSMKAEKEEKRLKCLQDIRGLNQTQKHDNECSRRVEGTGDWVLESKPYLYWKEHVGQLLWLKGMAGCGKTVLCANIIEDVMNLCKDDIKKGFIYFYIDANDKRTFDTECLYRTFMRQLADQLPNAPELLSDFLWKQEDYQSRTKSLEKACQNALFHLSRQFDEIFMVIDGLDECEDSTGLKSILKFIQGFLEELPKRAHALASSRGLAQIRKSFDVHGATCIEVDASTVDNDIRTALQVRFSDDAEYDSWPRSLRDTVETALVTQAKGSFRWLDCQLHTLKKYSCSTPHSIQQVLQALPKTLEEHYTQILERIDEINQTPTKNLLCWVAFGLRPLTLTEIANVPGMKPEEVYEPSLDDDLKPLDVEGFIDLCSDLVTKTSSTETFRSSDNIVVQLAHYSVREFLTRDTIRRGSSSRFALEKELTHAYLTKSCLLYFQQNEKLHSSDISAAYPLLHYAGRYWLEHMQSAGRLAETPTLQSMLKSMFDSGKVFFNSWNSMIVIDMPWLSTVPEERTNISPLYCAAYTGLVQMTEWLIANGADVDAPGGLYGTALQAAAKKGHLLVVKALINAHADVNAGGDRIIPKVVNGRETNTSVIHAHPGRGIFGSAIAAASAGGHHDVVQTLLEAGAEVQPQRRFLSDGKNDALLLSVLNGHYDTCKILLNHGAKDFYKMKGRPCTALHGAAQSGRLDLVKLLLGHEPSLDSNQNGRSGIIRSASSGISASQYAAAARGDKDILRELLAYGITEDETLRYAARAGDHDLVRQSLSRGANLESEGSVSDHPRALQSAALGGHVSIVRDLLSRGADPNLRSDYSSAMEAATNSGNLEVVQILLDAGANANPERPWALSNALRKGHKDIARLLVERGADMHVCLRRAVIAGDWRSFDILLELGADVHRRSPEDETTIFQAAAFGGSTQIIEHLLASGWGPDAEDESQETSPLTEAIRCKRWEVVKILLEHGSNVNAIPPADSEPRQGGGSVYDGNIWPPQLASETPLSMAIKQKRHDVALALIERGAIISPATPTSIGTPLLYAILGEMVGLVEILLTRGADPLQRGTILRRGKPTFPLLLAAEKENLDIFRELVNAGAMVNEQDDEDFSATHTASVCKETEILTTLIREHQADIHLRLLNGSQPIHSAAARGKADHVRILLDAGAPVNSTNADGRTPLHWAAEVENWDVVELLLDRGADVKLRADEGKLTALDMAHIAQEGSYWTRRENAKKHTQQWDEEKVEKLFAKLKPDIE